MSFQLNRETYLVEAKWPGSKIGKLTFTHSMGSWSRRPPGRGESSSATVASLTMELVFGRGKRVIFVDGLDLYEMLDREIPWKKFLELKGA